MDDKAIYTHRMSWKRDSGWCRDTGRRTPTTRLAPLLSTAPRGPSSPAVHTVRGARLPSPAQSPRGAWLLCRPRRPRGVRLPCRPPQPGGPSSLWSTPPPSRRRSPTGLPVPPPGGFSCLGLCRSSCPFPALFPRLLLLHYFTRLLPIPRWSHRLGGSISTFTHGEQPRASPRRRPSGSICPQKAVP